MVFKRLFLVCIFALTASFAVAEAQYDPQHTMLALNMAIVSVHRIISSKDRVLLTN